MLIKFLLLTASIYSVLSDDCVRYTFEEDFGLFSNNLDGCGNHQGLLSPWTRQSYTNTNVSAPNARTEWFISPSTSLSCISSFPFSMESGGVVEVHVYIDPTEREDHLAVMVHQIVEAGSHPVVGMGHVSGHSSPGWLVTRIDLSGPTQFNGYITFLGVAYPGSVLIVDSFRYVGPSLDPNETCILYEDDNAFTTIPTTSPPIAETTTPTTLTTEPSIIETTIPTTTETTTLSDDCVKYTFDDNFELFSNDLDGCGNHQGLLSSWNYETYTNSTLPAPNAKTNWFMSPSTSLSCISSFSFTMKSFGVLEVLVYLNSRAAEGHITVVVHQIVDSGSHPAVGVGYLNGDDKLGWVVIRINLVAITQFYGYVTFLGFTSPDSVLIVDSFRYVGPSLDPNEKCILYEDDNAITTIPIITPTIVPSTTPSITETITPTIVPSTTPSITETITPTIVPSTTPSITPTIVPSTTPSITETITPTIVPSTTPSITETITPTIVPSTTPSITETITPTIVPSTTPSITETITPTIVPTATPTEIPSTSETTASVTETTIPPTTETIDQNTDCIKYTVDEDFEELFVENLPGCTNHQEPRASWSLQAYSNATIEPPNVQSKWFISPSVAFSCTSSFHFPMMTGGLLEVLTYWEATPGNSLDIYVHAFVIGGFQALARVQVVTPGWQVVTIPMNVTGWFPGYLTFTGSRSPNSFVIVDSFRYVAPSLDTEECVLYPDSSTTALTPTETTVPTTTDGMLLTTTDRPTLTTTDTNDTDSNNPLEKIIIIKKTKTIRTESTVIKKVFRFNK